MKKLLALALALIAGGFAMPNSAEASGFSYSSGSSYVSGRASCGCATQTRRVFYGYDRHHHPIYRYVQIPITHTCRAHAPQYRQQSHYRNGYVNQRSHYGNRYDSRRSSYQNSYRGNSYSGYGRSNSGYQHCDR